MKSSMSAFRTVLLLFLISGGSANGQSYYYQPTNNPADVLIGLRQVGNPYEILIDAGSVQAFRHSVSTNRFRVASVDSDLVCWVFSPNLSRLDIAVFASDSIRHRPLVPFPKIWLSRGRVNGDIPADPWNRILDLSLLSVGSAIQVIGLNGNPVDAPFFGSKTGSPAVVRKTDTVFSYSSDLGAGGDFKQTFPGDIEAQTPDDFGTNSPSMKVDFFELASGIGPSVWLGTFELTPRGELWFIPAPAPPSESAAIIQAIQRTGTTNRITFATGSERYSYSLLRAPAGGFSFPTELWSIVAGPVPGTGGSITLSDSSDAATQFYRIEVTP